MPRQPRAFLSRTTAGLAALAEKVTTVLTERGFEIDIRDSLSPFSGGTLPFLMSNR